MQVEHYQRVNENTVTRKELLALVFACKHFRHYLYGHKVMVRTDHSALKWLMSFKDPQGQVASCTVMPTV